MLIGGPGNAFCRKVIVLDKPVSGAFAAVIVDPHSYACPSWMEIPGMEHNWLLAGSLLKYRLFVNGRTAGIGPARPVDPARTVETHFPLTGILHKGVNVVGVSVARRTVRLRALHPQASTSPTARTANS